MVSSKSCPTLLSCLPTTTAYSTSLQLPQRYDLWNFGYEIFTKLDCKADKEDHKLTILHKTRSDFVKGRKNVESLLPYSEPPHETWAGYFTKEVKALITEKAVHHIGDNSKYVDIVGDVINLVPVRWVSEKIVSAPPHPVQS